MTLLPVIERELRAESRNPFTYWLRFFGATALLGAGAWFFTTDGISDMAGEELFRVLHRTLFAAIWIVATLMTVDCISRERREGTLELLFLTPLRPFEVVIAKGMVHGLRAMVACLAALPVLVVPFLMGGVGWRVGLTAMLIDFSALFWAMAVGILASSLCRTMGRALVLAAPLEGVAFIVFFIVHGAGVVGTMMSSRLISRPLPPVFESSLTAGLVTVADPSELISTFASFGQPGAVTRFLIVLAAMAFGSLMMCLVVAKIAASNLRRVVHEKGPSAALQKMEKRFCTPTFATGFFRRWMRRVLERNPVGWLERRTWQGRIGTWSWLAVMISVLSWGLAQGGFQGTEIFGLMTLLAWGLVANVALTSAGSLRRERESGVIELLLVSPLSIEQIISGRLCGIAGQLLPALAILFGSWMWLLREFSFTSSSNTFEMESGPIWICYFAVTLVTVPVVGLYFSLRCRMFIVALFWTAVLAVALPWVLSYLILAYLTFDVHAGVPVYWLSGFGILIAGAGFILCVKRVAASKGYSVVLAVCLFLIAALCFATCLKGEWQGEERLQPAVLLGSTIQIGVAVLLGALLRRRLLRREFSFPQ